MAGKVESNENLLNALSVEDLRLRAKWCESAERYDDMVNAMTKLIEKKESGSLDEEERNLLSVAYKNVVGARRSSWRVINVKLAEEDKPNLKQLCEGMKKKVEEELKDLCNKVLNLLDKKLIANSENIPAKIFFLKMKGDYHRYMVEICSSDETTREGPMNKAEQSYQDALDIAKEKLPSTSPIRLGLALNYSVFFYEIKNDRTKACELAKSSFDDAIAELDDAAEDVYKDSTLIMQLLRDNLTLWKSELEEDQEQTAGD